MLKQRLCTAMVLIPGVIALVFYTPRVPFALITLLVYLLAAWEWSNFLGIQQKRWRFAYMGCMFILLFGLKVVPKHLWILLACSWWGCAAYLVAWYPRVKQVWSRPTGLVLMSIATLIPFYLVLNLLQQVHVGPWLLMYLLLLVWSADTGAYCAGKRWGKHKLAPHVSPGKTWEGVAGAVVLALAVGIVIPLTCFPQLSLLIPSWSKQIILIVIVVVASIVGDLLESMLKRERGIKDSGRCLPGHGGILDRIDGLLAALPVAVFCLVCINSKIMEF